MTSLVEPGVAEERLCSLDRNVFKLVCLKMWYRGFLKGPDLPKPRRASEASAVWSGTAQHPLGVLHDGARGEDFLSARSERTLKGRPEGSQAFSELHFFGVSSPRKV